MIWLVAIILIILMSAFYQWYDRNYINLTTSDPDFKEVFWEDSVFSKSSSQIMKGIVKAYRNVKVSEWVINYSNPIWFADLQTKEEYERVRIPIVRKYEEIIRDFIQSELKKKYLKNRIQTSNLWEYPLGNILHPSIFSTITKSGSGMSIVVSRINHIHEKCIYYFVIVDDEVVSYCRTEPHPHEEYKINVTHGNLACKKFVNIVKNKLEKPYVHKYRELSHRRINKENEKLKLKQEEQKRDFNASVDERVEGIRKKYDH
jgi:hypothetical protein